MGMVGGGLGVGGIVVAVIAYFLGFDPGTAIQVGQQVSNSTHQESRAGRQGTPEDQMGQFVSKVLGSTEDVWTKVFDRSSAKVTLVPARIVLDTSTPIYSG